MNEYGVKLRLDQDDTGYRYNRDSFLLADFIDAAHARTCIDMCAGVGVVSILIGLRYPQLRLTAIELRKDLALRAAANARQSGLGEYSVAVGDIMAASSMFRGRPFDAVVSNPPYYKKGSGRINPDRGRAVARHEIAMSLAGLVGAASRVLKKNGKLSLIMIYERLGEYLSILDENGFSQTRLREVVSFPDGEAKLFLSEATYGAGPECLHMSPFVLKSQSGEDSKEFRELMARYV